MSEPLELVPDEPKHGRGAPWGSRLSLRVLFPCEVRHDNTEPVWRARCRELGIITGPFPKQEEALEALRKMIRAAAVEWSKRRIGA